MYSNSMSKFSLNTVVSVPSKRSTSLRLTSGELALSGAKDSTRRGQLSLLIVNF